MALAISLRGCYTWTVKERRQARWSLRTRTNDRSNKLYRSEMRPFPFVHTANLTQLDSARPFRVARYLALPYVILPSLPLSLPHLTRRYHSFEFLSFSTLSFFVPRFFFFSISDILFANILNDIVSMHGSFIFEAPDSYLATFFGGERKTKAERRKRIRRV